MIIESLELNNFRNYDSLNISFSPGTNILYGDNAQGKTNILEAIFVSSTTKSHKGSKDREIIKFGEEEAHIRTNLLKDNVDYKVDMHLRKSKSKGIAIDGNKIKKAAELMGLLNVVFFSPEDLSIMKEPHSYTAEDVVEINCHGGVLVIQKIYDLLLCMGASPAEPGEFTKRAFLNGRIDLSEAEAVMEIINSQNEFALKSSIDQLNGNISNTIINLRKELIYQLAYIESAIDDPEHFDLSGYSDKLEIEIDRIMKEIDKLIGSVKQGKLLKEGINTVIIGKPNAGKSSILNILAGKDKAIVTDIAGTTRDILEETINIEDITLNIIDTAGIHDTEDKVEIIGVQKALEFAEKADLIVYVVDSSVDLDENDNRIIEFLLNRKCIVILNKNDLQQRTKKEDLEKRLKDNYSIIEASAKNQVGFDIFCNSIKKMFFNGDIKYNNEIYVTNTRHRNELLKALESLNRVKKSIKDGLPEDFYSIDITDAYQYLGYIIGEEVTDDLVTEIFSKFCMGK